MQPTAVFCEIRYRLNPDRLDDFADYARAWIALIEKHNGVHHGFFVPRAAPGDATISFPGIGQAGATDVAVALYGFPDEQSYNDYRTNIPLDPEAAAVIERFAEPPFDSYERVFLSPVPRENPSASADA